MLVKHLRFYNKLLDILLNFRKHVLSDFNVLRKEEYPLKTVNELVGSPSLKSRLK